MALDVDALCAVPSFVFLLFAFDLLCFDLLLFAFCFLR